MIETQILLDVPRSSFDRAFPDHRQTILGRVAYGAGLQSGVGTVLGESWRGCGVGVGRRQEIGAGEDPMQPCQRKVS